MKWILKIVGALVVVALFSGSAMAQCVPVAPKEWTGEVAAPSGGWVSATFFEKNACSWNGQDAILNGFDALAFDMAGYQKLPITVEAAFQAPTANSQAKGVFYNDKCENIGYWGPAAPEAPATFVAPEGTKWMTVMTNPGEAGTSVTAKSGGATCTVTTQKTKKKRRR